MTKEDIPDTITSIDGLWVKVSMAQGCQVLTPPHSQ